MKKWYNSKTIQAGVIAILIAAGTAITSGLSPRDVVLAVVGALVIYLRTITTGPVS